MQGQSCRLHCKPTLPRTGGSPGGPESFRRVALLPLCLSAATTTRLARRTCTRKQRQLNTHIESRQPCVQASWRLGLTWSCWCHPPSGDRWLQPCGDMVAQNRASAALPWSCTRR